MCTTNWCNSPKATSALPVRVAAINAAGADSIGSLPSAVDAAGRCGRSRSRKRGAGRVGACRATRGPSRARFGRQSGRKIDKARGDSSPGDQRRPAGRQTPCAQIATLDNDAAAVKAAIDALECSPAASASEALLRLTRYPACRDLCVTALSRMDDLHLDQIARGLSHELLDVRRATVEALSRHKSGRARELLEAVRNDPQRSIQHAANKALAVSPAVPSYEAEP